MATRKQALEFLDEFNDDMGLYLLVILNDTKWKAYCKKKKISERIE